MARRTIKGRRPSFWLRALSWAAVGLGLISAVAWGYGRMQPESIPRKNLALKYRQELGMTYKAQVRLGEIYTKEQLLPEDLPSWQTQAEPPVSRRALMLSPLQRLEISAPYTLEFDRPMSVTGQLYVRGYLVGQRLFQRPVAILQPQDVKYEGTTLTGAFKFDLDLQSLSKQLASAFQEAHMAPGAGELWLEPALEWKATGAGSADPVTGKLNGSRYIIYMYNTHLEIEERPVTVKEQTLQTNGQEPKLLSLLGRRVTVVRFRAITGWSALLFLGLGFGAYMFSPRKQISPAEARLLRLANVTNADSLKIDPAYTRVRIRSHKDLLQLHALTGRPILRTPDAFYLLDDGVCYALPVRGDDDSAWQGLAEPSPLRTVAAAGQPAAPPAPPAPSGSDALAAAVEVELFTLDPWITEVQVKSLEHLTQMASTSGRALIRTNGAYHLLEGSVCFTYRNAGSVTAVAASQ